jgi:hypothetical protein
VFKISADCHIPVGKKDAANSNLPGGPVNGRKYSPAGIDMMLENVTSICHFYGIHRALKAGIYFNCVRFSAAKNKIDPDRSDAAACSSNPFRYGNHMVTERVIERSD